MGGGGEGETYVFADAWMRARAKSAKGKPANKLADKKYSNSKSL